MPESEQTTAQPNSVYHLLDSHLQRFFDGHHLRQVAPTSLHLSDVLPRLVVYEVTPGPRGKVWFYISFGLWEMIHDDVRPIELLVIAPMQNPRHIEILFQLAHYHSFAKGQLDLGHTIPIGEPWLPESQCDHLLIAHPYPLGRAFEHCQTPDFAIRILWALPITKAERDYKAAHGLEELERKFVKHKLAYWQPSRVSIV